ncbi:MAG: hypothetical protein ACK47R_01765, partial [Planctomycetia bacterium]
MSIGPARVPVVKFPTLTKVPFRVKLLEDWGMETFPSAPDTPPAPKEPKVTFPPVEIVKLFPGPVIPPAREM